MSPWQVLNEPSPICLAFSTIGIPENVSRFAVKRRNMPAGAASRNFRMMSGLTISRLGAECVSLVHVSIAFKIYLTAYCIIPPSGRRRIRARSRPAAECGRVAQTTKRARESRCSGRLHGFERYEKGVDPAGVEKNKRTGERRIDVRLRARTTRLLHTRLRRQWLP